MASLPPKPEKAKALDANIIENLAADFCTAEEIAAILECSSEELKFGYQDALQRGHERAKSDLRREQWRAAQRGNIPMLIWLGKQYLSQSDKVANCNAYLGNIEHDHHLSLEELRELPLEELVRRFRAAIAENVGIQRES